MQLVTRFMMINFTFLLMPAEQTNKMSLDLISKALMRRLRITLNKRVRLKLFKKKDKLER